MTIFSFFLLGLVFLSHLINDRSQAALISGAILLFGFLGIVFRNYFQKKRHKFYAQLCSEKAILDSGNSTKIEGVNVSSSSILSYDEASIGMLLTSIRVRLPYRLKTEKRPLSSLICILVSLISGWWSITGPLDTIIVLKDLLSGGPSLSLGSLLSKAPLETSRHLSARKQRPRLKKKPLLAKGFRTFDYRNGHLTPK